MISPSLKVFASPNTARSVFHFRPQKEAQSGASRLTVHHALLYINVNQFLAIQHKV
jgi:hypothetical protein